MIYYSYLMDSSLEKESDKQFNIHMWYTWSMIPRHSNNMNSVVQQFIQYSYIIYYIIYSDFFYFYDGADANDNDDDDDDNTEELEEFVRSLDNCVSESLPFCKSEEIGEDFSIVMYCPHDPH